MFLFSSFISYSRTGSVMRYPTCDTFRVCLLIFRDLVEPAIDLQDSLEEPRIPTPPLPDLVPFLSAPEISLHSNTSPSYITPEHHKESYRWDWVGLADNSKKIDLPILSTQNVESQILETEGNKYVCLTGDEHTPVR